MKTRKDKRVVLITRNNKRKNKKSRLYYPNYNGDWILEKERESDIKAPKDD